MTELNRIIRHLIAPLVIIAVQRGWIPENAQKEIIEALTVLLALLVPLVWSKLREKAE